MLEYLALVPFYLIGAFPSGQILAKLRGLDLAAHGSGNVGATNAARVLGKKQGLLTLLLDVSKAFLGLLLADLFSVSDNFVALAAVAIVAGHCFSIPTKLRGGKGVATALGVAIYFNILLAILTLIVFFSIFSWKKYVSLASICAVSLAPILSYFIMNSDSYSYALTAIAIIVIFRHKQNLIRLTEGREPKFEKKLPDS